MSNERHYDGWGDPCPMCQDQREHDPAWHVQRATHGDLCARHFLAAPPHVKAVIALSMPPGPVPFLGPCPDYPPVWLGGEAA